MGRETHATAGQEAGATNSLARLVRNADLALHFIEIRGERTTVAEGGSAAMSFAHSDREGMKLVEEPGVVRRGIIGKGLAGEIGHGVVSLAIVAGRRREKPVARGDAAQVFVGDGNGMAQGVEQDGVGGLRTDGGQGQQAGAQGGSRVMVKRNPR